MSLKFAVKLPLEVLSSLQAGPGTEGYLNNMLIANKAMLAAINAMPYQVTPKSSVKHREPKSRVNVKTLDGRVHTFNIRLSTTVLSLKILAAKAEGMEPGDVFLIFRGRLLGALGKDLKECDEDASLVKVSVAYRMEVRCTCFFVRRSLERSINRLAVHILDKTKPSETGSSSASLASEKI